MSMTELRSDWLIGYYALGRDEFSAKTICILNNFSSERVDSKGFSHCCKKVRVFVVGFFYSNLLSQKNVNCIINFFK